MGYTDWISKIANFFSGKRELSAASSAVRLGAVPYYTSTCDAMTIAAVYRCVKFLSESVAVLPIQCMRLKGEIFVEDYGNPLSMLLNVQPSDDMSAFEFKRSLVMQVLLRGNAYIVPTIGVGQITGLTLCSPWSVSHDTEANVYTVSDQYHKEINGTYSADEIVHIKGFCDRNNPRHGLSVLSYAQQTIDIAGTANKETQRRFATGGMPRGIVSDEGSSVQGWANYKGSEIDKVAYSIDDKFGEGANTVGLHGNLKYFQLTMTSADMQFLESRKFTVLEICRFFGVDPSFVFADVASNYKSAEKANTAFLSHTLNPLLCSIESELLRKLVPSTVWRYRRIQFDRRAVHACDLDSLMRYGEKAIATGMYTVNEWRRFENLPPVEGGDRAMISANLRPVEDTSQTEVPAATKPQ